MPRYDYRCEGCKRTVEQKHPIGNAPEICYDTCPHCGGLQQHRRLYSPPFLAPDGTYSFADKP